MNHIYTTIMRMDIRRNMKVRETIISPLPMIRRLQESQELIGMRQHCRLPMY